MIYQLENKRIEILAIASFHISIYASSIIMFFALLISMPSFNSNNFYQNRPKIKLFLLKNTKFWSARGSARRPPYFRGKGASPPDPRDSPPPFRILATRLPVA